MSILLKEEIEQNYFNNKIIIKPYNHNQLGSNSYDVRLGNILKIYNGEILDVKSENSVTNIKISNEGLVLKPGVLYLGSTIEAIGSDYFVPMYEGRSSMARLGIQSHISAGFGDLGFKSNWTLEIVVIHQIKIYHGMKIGQIYFHTVNNEYNIPENRYKGKYKNQTEPQESKSYLDYKSFPEKI